MLRTEVYLLSEVLVIAELNGILPADINTKTRPCGLNPEKIKKRETIVQCEETLLVT